MSFGLLSKKYVTLPCSSEARWKVISATLKETHVKSINSCEELAIFMSMYGVYDPIEKTPINLNGLQKALSARSPSAREISATFFVTLLPHIAKHAAKLSYYMSKYGRLEVLAAGSTNCVSIPRAYVYSILCNLFLGTFVWKEKDALQPRETYSDFQLSQLLCDDHPTSVAKILCLLSYFLEMERRETKALTESGKRSASPPRPAAASSTASNPSSLSFSAKSQTTADELMDLRRGKLWDKESNGPAGLLVVARKALRGTAIQTANEWTQCCQNMTEDVELSNMGRIEDFCGDGQVTFSNPLVGESFLGRGAAQEEITFATRPELIVLILICEEIKSHETISVVGAERFSLHGGYGKSFTFQGKYIDQSHRFGDGTPQTSYTLIDALHFHTHTRDLRPQLQHAAILRDLCKAYVGFDEVDVGGRRGAGKEEGEGEPEEESEERTKGLSILFAATYNRRYATGNWGCGKFGGYKPLKALIQYIAAARAQRPLVFCTFGDTDLYERLKRFVRASGAFTVGEVARELFAYAVGKVADEKLSVHVDRLLGIDAAIRDRFNADPK